MTSISNNQTNTPRTPPPLHRHRSTEDDRIALISNLPPDATEMTVRHFLAGTMSRKASQVGAEPTIAKVRFLTPYDEQELLLGGDVAVAVTVTTALVEFASSQDCHVAISMLQPETMTSGGTHEDSKNKNEPEEPPPLSFQGHRLHIQKLTGACHVDHAERNERIRSSLNKRSGVDKYGTDYAELDDPSHLKQEVNRLEGALSLERVALSQTRDALLEEQNRQVENDETDEMLVATTSAVLNRSKEALGVEQAKRASLEDKVASLEMLLIQAEKETQRLSINKRMAKADDSELHSSAERTE